MTEDQWQPSNELEELLRLTRGKNDQAAFLSQLVKADLLCPQDDDEDPEQPTKCLVTQISGRLCLLAFTSWASMVQMVGERPYGFARIRGLAAEWPSPDIYLAINPGSPIDAYLTEEALTDLAVLAGEPSSSMEADLLLAAENQDVQQYLWLLVRNDVFVPVLQDPGMARQPDPSIMSQADFPWIRIDQDAAITVFTSVDRMREALQNPEYLRVAFSTLASVWPEGSNMAIDYGAAHGVEIMGGLIRELGTRIKQEFGY